MPPLVTVGIIVVGYMGAPTYAHLLTRLITREGWRDLHLRPNFRRGWPAWLGAWFLPGILTIRRRDRLFRSSSHSTMTRRWVRSRRCSTGRGADRPASAASAVHVAGLQTLQGLLLAPLLNAIPTFGEEFGWRAYLQPKLMVLGWRKGDGLDGRDLGRLALADSRTGPQLWLNYPGAPWLGMLAFVWFTFILGTLLGWLTIRGGSVWPAVIGHGALERHRRARHPVCPGQPQSA